MAVMNPNPSKSLDIEEIYQSLMNLTEIDVEGSGSRWAWFKSTERASSAPPVPSTLQRDLGHQGNIGDDLASTNKNVSGGRSASCPFPYGDKGYYKFISHDGLSDEEEYYTDDSDDEIYAAGALAVGRLSRSRTCKRTANSAAIVTVDNNENPAEPTGVLGGLFAAPSSRRPEENEYQTLKRFQDFCTRNTVSITDILHLASLPKLDREDLIWVADVLYSKLRLETELEANVSLSEKRWEAFHEFVFRIYCENKIELRIIRLFMVRRCLLTYHDDFERICRRDIGLVEVIDDLLAQHRQTSGEELTGFAKHLYESEFELLKEIAEWIDLAMRKIRWLKFGCRSFRSQSI